VEPKGHFSALSSSISTTLRSSLRRIIGSNLNLRIDDKLLLDWSNSYDENNINQNNNSILFEWSCFKISPSYQSNCDKSLIFTPQYSSSLSIISGVIININNSFSSSQSSSSSSSSSSVINKVNEGDVFKLILKGKSSKLKDNRNCERIFDVVITSSNSPLLKLNIESQLSSTQSISSSGSIIKFNPSSKLKISGNIQIKSPFISGKATWSINNPLIDLSLISLSPISSNLDYSFFNTSSSVDIVDIGQIISLVIP